MKVFFLKKKHQEVSKKWSELNYSVKREIASFGD